MSELIAPKPSNVPAVATYSFNGMDLRVVEINGEPWFVAVDALVAMGYPKSSHSMVAAKLATDERAKFNLGLRGRGKVNIISESGLYKLTMRSDKKEAKQFQEWVTREVLPSIRKTGTYTMPGAKKAIAAPSRPRQKNVPPPL